MSTEVKLAAIVAEWAGVLASEATFATLRAEAGDQAFDLVAKNFAGWSPQALATEIETTLGWCESPIERLFAGAVMAYGGFRIAPSARAPAEDRLARFGLEPLGREEKQECKAIAFMDFPARLAWLFQPIIVIDGLSHRVDFVFSEEGYPPVCIELDGHDFHERTKEQARRDRSRDRRMQTAGWAIARFTGSEVYAEPMACVEEVLRLCAGSRRRRSA